MKRLAMPDTRRRSRRDIPRAEKVLPNPFIDMGSGELFYEEPDSVPTAQHGVPTSDGAHLLGFSGEVTLTDENPDPTPQLRDYSGELPEFDEILSSTSDGEETTSKARHQGTPQSPRRWVRVFLGSVIGVLLAAILYAAYWVFLVGGSLPFFPQPSATPAPVPRIQVESYSESTSLSEDYSQMLTVNVFTVANNSDSPLLPKNELTVSGTLQPCPATVLQESDITLEAEVPARSIRYLVLCSSDGASVRVGAPVTEEPAVEEPTPIEGSDTEEVQGE